MNSNQRSQENNQTDNGANEKSPSRGVTADKDNLNQSQQAGTVGGSQQKGGSQQQGGMQPGQGGGSSSAPQSGSMGTQQSTNRAGSQTEGSQQSDIHGPNEWGAGMPRSAASRHLSADEKMDDDTGLSNRANAPSEFDAARRQMKQSNVGRRDDGTPD